MAVAALLIGALPALLLAPDGVAAQVEAAPILSGTAFLGDTPLTGGTVVLHHLTEDSRGELDSLRTEDDGAFSFVLPGAPDPARSDIYFASVRHDGVLYFGPAITAAVQLDSLYEIHAYDTLLAPAEGAPVATQSRSVFFEPDSASWRVTDLFELRNDLDRTIVARAGGRTWSYPLPAEARDVVAGDGEMSLDAAAFEEGSLVVRAALPPGERLFVVRYRVDAPFLSIPTPGETDAFDILIREPAPTLDIDGFEELAPVELEQGAVYRRFASTGVRVPAVTLVEIEQVSPPPVEWIAVILTMVLTAGGLVAVLGRRAPTPAAQPVSRAEVLMQVARLDEDFEARTSPSRAERAEHARLRRELLAQLPSGS